MPEWKCAGCGAPSPDKARSCECPTSVVYYREGKKDTTAWKIGEDPSQPDEPYKIALRRIVSLEAKNVPKYAQQIAREALGDDSSLVEKK